MCIRDRVEKGAVCEEEPARVKSIKGWEYLDEVVMVDQSMQKAASSSSYAVFPAGQTQKNIPVTHSF